ncbi:putative nucleoside-diphosphate-sugar epimerase [Xylariaceae sp. AK1471]|nr:putative nucleoside-diphosphate-sugar epimerase [Xylariaceae sp. AK1471]
MSEILVVTCPSGKQCSVLLPHLYEQGKFKLRLAGHSQSSVTKLRATYPEAEVQACNLTSREACRSLLRGATAVYHVGPSLNSAEKEIGFNMVDAAVVESQRPGNNFKHFVFSSVLGTQHRNLMQHDLKSQVEERLFLSPLQWTVLQPTNFMDAYPIPSLAKSERPSVILWHPNHGNSVVSLHDLAEAAAKVLNEREAHFYAQYPLCSTLPISDSELIAVVEKYIGKHIDIQVPSFEARVEMTFQYLYGGSKENVFAGNQSGEETASSHISPQGDPRPDLVRDAAERLVLFYNNRGLTGSPNVLRWLLGREPTTVDEYVQRELRNAGLIAS